MKPGGLREEIAIAAIGLLAACAAGSILMMIAGASPWTVWSAMITRTVGDPYGLGQVLFKATPLVFTGLAVAVALAVGLFNIGGYGQVVAGCLACGALGAALPSSTPAPIAIGACLLAAASAGGAVGAATGAIRAYRGAHEVIVAILLNAIVAGVALWIGNTALFEPGTTSGPTIIAAAELPGLGVAGSAANTSAIVALIAAIAVGWWLARTTRGFAWRMVGASPGAAEASGVAVARTWVAAMAASGALAGLAAATYVLGYKHCYQDGQGRGAGFLGIAVALLGRGSAIGVVIAALFVGFLQHAGLVVADLVPKELFDVLTAIMILAIAITTPAVRRHLRAAVRA